MLAIKAFELRNNQKEILDKVADGETVIVSRPKNKNIVVLSQEEYNRMEKASKNALYLEMIDKSMKELENGGSVPKTLEEMRNYEA